MATEPSIIPELLFETPPEALAPLEAGVDYTTCKECVVSGETITTVVSQPHAVYTNQFGKAVIQMNTVVLGGINGLNS